MGKFKSWFLGDSPERRPQETAEANRPLSLYETWVAGVEKTVEDPEVRLATSRVINAPPKFSAEDSSELVSACLKAPPGEHCHPFSVTARRIGEDGSERSHADPGGIFGYTVFRNNEHASESVLVVVSAASMSLTTAVGSGEVDGRDEEQVRSWLERWAMKNKQAWLDIDDYHEGQEFVGLEYKSDTGQVFWRDPRDRHSTAMEEKFSEELAKDAARLELILRQLDTIHGSSIHEERDRKLVYMIRLAAAQALKTYDRTRFEDDRSKEFADRVVEHGFLARRVEIEQVDAPIGDVLVETLDMYLASSPGFQGSIFAADQEDLTPFESGDDRPGLDGELPGWDGEFRRAIAETDVALLVDVFEENGWGQSVPSVSGTKLFGCGYMIHVWSEINPDGWLDGIGT